MINKEFKDTLRVSDSKIRGYVVLERDGKVIFKKENMIVENGRNYIKNLVHSKLIDGTSEARSISTLKFGEGTALVDASDTDLISNVLFYNKTLSITNLTVLSGDEIGLKVTVEVEGNDSPAASVTELGLFLSDGSLFSRLVFDVFPLNQNTTYNLTYYIYF
jgi:hypothetical protein